jgi:hypothetical protein
MSASTIQNEKSHCFSLKGLAVRTTREGSNKKANFSGTAHAQ